MNGAILMHAREDAKARERKRREEILALAKALGHKPKPHLLVRIGKAVLKTIGGVIRLLLLFCLLVAALLTALFIAGLLGATYGPSPGFRQEWPTPIEVATLDKGASRG